jgi:hypothetical protein
MSAQPILEPYVPKCGACGQEGVRALDAQGLCDDVRACYVWGPGQPAVASAHGERDRGDLAIPSEGEADAQIDKASDPCALASAGIGPGFCIGCGSNKRRQFKGHCADKRACRSESRAQLRAEPTPAPVHRVFDGVCQCPDCQYKAARERERFGYEESGPWREEL